MSMFDYDARPATPMLVLVGTAASRGGYAIRDFLSRNGYPFEWVDAGQPDAVRAVLGVAEVEPSTLPLCILPDGSRLASATVEQVATGLGMVADPALPEYDLTIVGAGPAGLGAAVNAASEGLRTVVVEAVAPGGQAGTTSMIENYLGFPNGISGSELATRAVVQARRFGAELLLARPLVDVSADGRGYVAELSDGTLIRGRAVLFASGVEWRRLEVPGIDDLLGAGVYYGGRAERGAVVHGFPGRRGGRRQLGGPGGRPVLPVCQAGHVAGPWRRPGRVDVAVPYRSAVGHPEC
jgi:thioredoxin reductase (NADPH)